MYLQASLLLRTSPVISICFPDSFTQVSHRSFCLKLNSLSYQLSHPVCSLASTIHLVTKARKTAVGIHCLCTCWLLTTKPVSDSVSEVSLECLSFSLVLWLPVVLTFSHLAYSSFYQFQLLCYCGNAGPGATYSDFSREAENP